MKIIQLYRKIKFHFIRNNSDKYIEHLKKSGIEIGKGNVIQWNCNIDETRPSLVTIGNDNFFSTGFTLLTHDWGLHCLETSIMSCYLQADVLLSVIIITLDRRLRYSKE